MMLREYLARYGGLSKRATEDFLVGVHVDEENEREREEREDDRR
jgi:chloramphenicol 3-O-phosphotransferase